MSPRRDPVSGNSISAEESSSAKSMSASRAVLRRDGSTSAGVASLRVLRNLRTASIAACRAAASTDSSTSSRRAIMPESTEKQTVVERASGLSERIECRSESRARAEGSREVGRIRK